MALRQYRGLTRPHSYTAGKARADCAHTPECRVLGAVAFVVFSNTIKKLWKGLF